MPTYRRTAQGTAATLVAALVVGACQGAPGVPSPGQSSTSVGATAAPPGPTPTATDFVPTLEPTALQPGVPILEDVAFLASSAKACGDTRPSGLYGVDAAKPVSKTTGYEWLHISVVEMRDPTGEIGPAPSLPPGEAYYPAAESLVNIPGGTEALAVEAPFAGWVDLLACVALRAGDSRTYSGQRALTVTALDAIVWLVDMDSGVPVGEPWVVDAGLPMLLNLDKLVRSGGHLFNVASVRPDIAFAMGLAVPLPGAYHGGDGSFVVARHDRPADLPAGTRLLPGFTFVIRLVVLENDSNVIDFVELLCAPVGLVSGAPVRVATAVPHDLGRFSASSADVVIEGEFTTQTEASGEIKALTARARDCGVPDSARWYVGLALQAQADGDGYRLLP